MLIKIEQCTEADLDLIIELTNKLLAGEKLLNPDSLKQYFSNLEGTEEIKCSEHHKAMIGDEPAGFIRIDICFKETGKPCGNISSLYVKEDHRGLGVGRGLMTYAIELCKNLECSCVTLGVNVNNIVSLGLYDSLGFTEYHRSLILDL